MHCQSVLQHKMRDIRCSYYYPSAKCNAHIALMVRKSFLKNVKNNSNKLGPSHSFRLHVKLVTLGPTNVHGGAYSSPTFGPSLCFRLHVKPEILVPTNVYGPLDFPGPSWWFSCLCNQSPWAQLMSMAIIFPWAQPVFYAACETIQLGRNQCSWLVYIPGPSQGFRLPVKPGTMCPTEDHGYYISLGPAEVLGSIKPRHLGPNRGSWSLYFPGPSRGWGLHKTQASWAQPRFMVTIFPWAQPRV